MTLITARGVRLNARLANGKISLGEVDRLLPPPTGLPFRFPDQEVDIADSTRSASTLRPAGSDSRSRAQGNLADGFRGRMAAAAPRLRLGSCRIDSVRGKWDVAIADLKPSFRGPAGAARLACGDRLAVPGIGLDLDARLAPGSGPLDRNAPPSGPTRLEAGSTLLTGLGGRLGLARRCADDPGPAQASTPPPPGSAGSRAARAAVDGRYGLSLDNGGFTLLGEAGAGASRRAAPLAGAVAALGSAGGTPIEPVGDAFAAALARAGAAFDADAALRLVNGRGFGGVRFERLSAAARSGARLELGGGQGLTYYWPSGLTRLDGRTRGGRRRLPGDALRLDQPRAGGADPRQRPDPADARPAIRGSRSARSPSPRRRAARRGSRRWRRSTGRSTNGWVARPGAADRRPDRRPRRLRLRRALHGGALRVAARRHACCSAGPRFRSARPAGLWSGRRRADGSPGGAELRNPRFAGTLGSSPLDIAGKPASLRLRRAELRRLRPRGAARGQPLRPRLAHRRFRPKRGLRPLRRPVGQARQRAAPVQPGRRHLAAGRRRPDDGGRAAGLRRERPAPLPPARHQRFPARPSPTTGSVPAAGSTIPRPAPGSPEPTSTTASPTGRGRARSTCPGSASTRTISPSS